MFCRETIVCWSSNPVMYGSHSHPLILYKNHYPLNVSNSNIICDNSTNFNILLHFNLLQSKLRQSSLVSCHVSLMCGKYSTEIWAFLLDPYLKKYFLKCFVFIYAIQGNNFGNNLILSSP